MSATTIRVATETWYIDCSVLDKSVPSEYCGEDCCEYDEEGKEETDET